MNRMHPTAKPLMMTLTLLLASLAGCLGGEATEPAPQIPELVVTLDAQIDGREATVIPSVAGGQAPHTYAWALDGDPVEPEGLVLSLTELEAGTYTVTFTATDAVQTAVTRDVIFTIEQWNRAPTIALDLPTHAYSGDAVAWSITTADVDGDVLDTTVYFGDGSPAATEASGSHAWTLEGSYTVTATATDPDGARAEAEAVIEITDNLPPTLAVTMDPSAESGIILTTDDALTLTIDAADPEGEVTGVQVHWDDGQGESVTDGSTSHTFATAGFHTISVVASDDRGQQTTWSTTVEVVEELTDTAVYTYFTEQVPEEDHVDEALDEDGDGEVDGSEDAREEEGYDWEGDFDENGDGQSDHDEGGVDSWDHKSDSNIITVAESDDTNGAGRDGGEGGSDDPLTDEDAHVTDDETDSEWEDDTNLSDHDDVMDELFEDTEDDQEDASDEPAFEPEYYEDLVNGTHALWWNETWQEDLDQDGSIDTDCVRVTAAVWVDADHDMNPSGRSCTACATVTPTSTATATTTSSCSRSRASTRPMSMTMASPRSCRRCTWSQWSGPTARRRTQTSGSPAPRRSTGMRMATTSTRRSPRRRSARST